MNVETFWARIAEYNEATLPVQVVLVVAAVILAYLTFAKPCAKTNVWMKVFLAIAFAWNGVVFFLVFAKNPIATFFGAPLFIILAVLFIVDIFAKRTEFQLPDAKWKRGLTVLWVLMALLYPLTGLPLGHTYPRMLTPVMPCPLTVFTLAMVSAAIPKVDRKLYVLLLPWALTGLPKCLGACDCYEDCILLAAGIYGLILLIKNWNVISTVQRLA